MAAGKQTPGASGGEGPPAGAGEPRLGELLLEEGLITQAQLDRALAEQATRSAYAPIGQVLIDQHALSRTDLVKALARHKKRLRLGYILVRAGAITMERLNGALSYQRKTGVRVGDALLQLGLVTERQLRLALCAQLNIPFTELEQFTPDPTHRLERLIDPNYAVGHRLVPIGRNGNTLTVVMDDPTDEAAVREIEVLTGCAVEVATTWRANLERALRQVYGMSSARAASAFRTPGSAGA